MVLLDLVSFQLPCARLEKEVLNHMSVYCDLNMKRTMNVKLKYHGFILLLSLKRHGFTLHNVSVI